MKSALRDSGKRHLWLGFGQAPSYFDQPSNIVIARTEGCYAYDVEGRRFLDALGGQGAAALGYNYPAVIEAMRRQLELQVGNVSGFPPSDVSVGLAQKLAALLPEGLNRVFYSHSGSEANDAAMKLARQFHKISGHAGKFKVISRWGGYHGSTLATTAVSGFPWRRRAFEPLPSGFIHVAAPNCFRCPSGKSGREGDLCGICSAGELRTVIEREGPDTVAAVLMELTMGSGGVISPPVEHVKAVRKLCDEHDVLMIVDEVATGFGKTGTLFEVEQYGIVPDMMTIGKSLTGGHAPLSAIAIHDRIAQRFDQAGAVFDTGFTSAGNPLACAAALATLQVLEETRILDQIPRKHEYLSRRLHDIAAGSRVVGDVRGKGMMMAVELVADARSRAPFADPVAVRTLMKKVQRECGVFFGGFGTTINMMLPLVITENQIDEVCAAIGRVVQAVESTFSAK